PLGGAAAGLQHRKELPRVPASASLSAGPSTGDDEASAWSFRSCALKTAPLAPSGPPGPPVPKNPLFPTRDERSQSTPEPLTTATKIVLYAHLYSPSRDTTLHC